MNDNCINFGFGYIMVLHGYAYITYRFWSRVHTKQLSHPKLIKWLCN